MAAIFVPHIKELLDSAKDIDIHIVIENEDDISNGNLTKVIDELVKSSYPYTRQSVIHVHNYIHIVDIHINIPWRHQIIFHKDQIIKPTNKYKLLIDKLPEVEFKDNWFIDILNNKEDSLTTRGWSFSKYD